MRQAAASAWHSWSKLLKIIWISSRILCNIPFLMLLFILCCRKGKEKKDAFIRKAYILFLRITAAPMTFDSSGNGVSDVILVGSKWSSRQQWNTEGRRIQFRRKNHPHRLYYVFFYNGKTILYCNKKWVKVSSNCYWINLIFHIVFHLL